MRGVSLAALLVACGACRGASPSPSDSHLFVWAGDADRKASDFLAVIDASPESPRYGTIVASVATGEAGTHPHHTELVMPENDHLLANGFHAGRSWLFDLSQPLQPRILTSFGAVGGYSHPHSYTRLANGHVLATFQYRADSAAPDGPAHEGEGHRVARTTGALVEMDETGKAIRVASAEDTAIGYKGIYPYSALPLPAIDRIVSTTTDMDEKNTAATSEWVQLWRLADLKLLRSIRLPPGPRGDEHQYTGEPRELPEGAGVYIHTFSCGLYLLRGAERPEATVTLVHTFEGENCGVPVLTGRFWLQTVPKAHAVVVLDVGDPERPREVSRLVVGADEEPHWISIDRSGRRVVLNSSGGGTGNRLFVLDFDPASGRLTMDERFRDAGSDRPGVTLTGKSWPHGFAGKAVPHGTVFSR